MKVASSAPAPDMSQGSMESGGEKRSARDWSLTDFGMDPDAQIWLPHLGRAQRQGALKQPWETCPVAKVFEASYCQPPKYHRCGFADALMGVSTKALTPDVPCSSRSPPEFVARRLRFASLSRDEDLVRKKCLQKLRSLILMDPPASQLGASLVTAAGSLVDEEEVTQSFKDAFSVKSTATLAKRLAALWPYAKWSLSTGRTPLNLDEAKVYEYLTYMRNQECSASAPSSFMEAVGFLHSIVDLKTLKGLSTFSGRCKGFPLYLISSLPFPKLSGLLHLQANIINMWQMNVVALVSKSSSSAMTNSEPMMASTLTGTECISL